MNALEMIKQNRFIAILRHIPVELSSEVARAMYDGGIRIFEVTFNPSSETTVTDTQTIIRSIYQALGEKDPISVGAGTVLYEEYAKAAYDAGAQFIVSPCTKPAVINFTKAHGMLSIPGAYTPTEIQNAYDLGADIVKVFPVAPNEVGYLKNVMSPLSHIPFIPTGGINPQTIESFMDTGALAVAAGATIATKDLAEAKNFAQITENARLHIEKVQKYRR